MKKILAALVAVAAFGNAPLFAAATQDSRTKTTFSNVVVTGTLEVDGTQNVDGSVSLSTVTISGSNGLRFATVVSTSTAPSAAGVLARNTANELYISTGTGAGAWVKVGGQ